MSCSGLSCHGAGASGVVAMWQGHKREQQCCVVLDFAEMVRISSLKYTATTRPFEGAKCGHQVVFVPSKSRLSGGSPLWWLVLSLVLLLVGAV